MFRTILHFIGIHDYICTETVEVIWYRWPPLIVADGDDDIEGRVTRTECRCRCGAWRYVNDFWE